MKRLLVQFTVILIASLAMSCAGKSYQKTVDRVEIDRFMGKWYVIAGRTTSMEKGAHNSVEVYRWNEKKKRIDIEFTFRKKSFTGKLKRMNQKAWIVNEETNAYWKVQPFWPVKIGYLVVDLDKDYQWTVIGVPNKKYLWVMARQPEMSEEQLQSILSNVADQGYPTENSIRVPHDWSVDVSSD